MKPIFTVAFAPLFLIAALTGCTPEAPTSSGDAPAADAAPTEVVDGVEEVAKDESTQTPAVDLKTVTAKPDAFGTEGPPVDIGGFGSEEPHETDDMHQRGIITFTGDDGTHTTQQHWEQFDWTGFEAKRWGRYHIRLTYTMRMSTLPMQFKVAEQRLKKTLIAAPEPRKTYLGTVYIPSTGPHPFSLYTSAKGVSSGIEIQEVAFIPAPEGEPIAQDGGSAITLSASGATTWSEAMRYEPKPEKQCLGYWTSEDDFAEWEFTVETPGRYQVTVSHGCGGGNEGSEVAILSGDHRLTFTVADTGGFQNWKDVAVGEVAFDKAGNHTLILDPVNRANKAVLDVQKVVLTPVN